MRNLCLCWCTSSRGFVGTQSLENLERMFVRLFRGHEFFE